MPAPIIRRGFPGECFTKFLGEFAVVVLQKRVFFSTEQVEVVVHAMGDMGKVDIGLPGILPMGRAKEFFPYFFWCQVVG